MLVTKASRPIADPQRHDRARAQRIATRVRWRPITCSRWRTSRAATRPRAASGLSSPRQRADRLAQAAGACRWARRVVTASTSPSTSEIDLVGEARRPGRGRG